MLCDAGAAAAAERAPAIVTSSYWNDAGLWHTALWAHSPAIFPPR